MTTSTILLTGGSGKTSSRIAQLLQAQGVAFLVASRKPEGVPAPYTGVRFDWFDEQTWDISFSATPTAPVKRVYLVSPPVPDPLPIMQKFIEHARGKGAERFVLLSASPIERGGPVYGKVHEYLATSGLEYCALRPTWFMENFFDGPNGKTIKEESKMYSGTDNGVIPWISAHDIAAVAVDALTAEKSYDSDPVLIGPELLSYDDTASILTEVLGRKITHEKLSYDGIHTWWMEKTGMPAEYATMMAKMDTMVKEGGEARWAKEPSKAIAELGGAKVIVGKKTMREVLMENKAEWA